MEQYNTSWSLNLNSKQKKILEFDHESNLFITNCCFGELPNNPKSVPCRIFATVSTLDISSKEEEDKLIKSNFLLTSLIPNELEHQNLNFIFSPLNIIELENKSEYNIHLIGYQIPVNLLNEEEEEEEEEEIFDENSGDSPSNQEEEEEELDPKKNQKMLQKLSFKKK